MGRKRKECIGQAIPRLHHEAKDFSDASATSYIKKILEVESLYFSGDALHDKVLHKMKIIEENQQWPTIDLR